MDNSDLFWSCHVLFATIRYISRNGQPMFLRAETHKRTASAEYEKRASRSAKRLSEHYYWQKYWILNI